MNESSDNDSRHDWRITATLGAVWVCAIVAVILMGTEIPLSMLATASIFFVVLIPAMNDLVRSIDKFFTRGSTPGADEISRGEKHE